MSTVGYGNVSLMSVYEEKYRHDIKIAIYMMMASILGFSLCQARLTSYIYGNNQREVNSDFFKQKLQYNMEAFFL
jgi:hypothetical protein